MDQKYTNDKMLWLNCKVIKKEIGGVPYFYINPPFSGLSPLCSKKFWTLPSDSIFRRGTEDRGEGGEGVSTM